MALEYTIFSLPEAVPDPEICQKTSLRPGPRPGPRWGSSRRSPRPPSLLGRGIPPPQTPPLTTPAARRHSAPSVPRCLPPPAENPGGAHVQCQSDLDSRLAYPRPRPGPRLNSFKTKTKTLMYKTKTQTQDLQDQYWKSMTSMDCDKQKD